MKSWTIEKVDPGVIYAGVEATAFKLFCDRIKQLHLKDGQAVKEEARCYIVHGKPLKIAAEYRSMIDQCKSDSMRQLSDQTFKASSLRSQN